MKKVSIVVLIVLGLLVTGCSKANNEQVKSEGAESKQILKVETEGTITDKDKMEVLEIMNVAFEEKDYKGALKNSFKDLETLRKIKEVLNVETLEETKEIIASRYEKLPIFENRFDFLDKFQPDSIEVHVENDKIVATIDIIIDGETINTERSFVKNENAEWYQEMDLVELAEVLQIDVSK